MSERKVCWFCERPISVFRTTNTFRFHLYPKDQEERPPLLVHGERCPGSGQAATR